MTTELDLSWLGNSIVQDLSGDAKHVLFIEANPLDQPASLCLRGTDGAPPVRLGEATGSAALSPDGKWALMIKPPSDFVLLPTGPGEERSIATGGLLNLNWDTRLPDGKRFFFQGQEPGHQPRTWVLDLTGGKPRAVTPESVLGYVACPDGRIVAGKSGKLAMYPVDGGEPRVIPDLDAEDNVVACGSEGRTLYYYVSAGAFPVSLYRMDVSTGRRELFKQLLPRDRAGLRDFYSIYLTTDGRYYAYSYGRSFSALYIVQGLK